MKQKVPHKAFLVALVAAALSLGAGCLGGGGSLTNLPEKEAATLNLHIRLGKVDASAPAGSGVGKVAAADTNADGEIVIKNMTLRFTSNLKDTVVSDVRMDKEEDGGAGGNLDGDERSVFVNVELMPLRWWNIEIKTYDQNDSVIHHGVVKDVSSKGGQTVNVSVPMLSSRFSLYEARYVLPEVIYARGLDSGSRVYQKIFFSRLVLAVDGKTVRDSTSFSPAVTSAGTRFITADSSVRGSSGRYFFRPNAAPDTVTHVQTYQYVETGNRSFQISAYGYLEGDSIGMTPRLLFQGNATINIAAGEIVKETPVVLDWKGPGSKPNDTTVTPGTPDWTGVGMKVEIGKTGKVTQDINIPSGLNL